MAGPRRRGVLRYYRQFEGMSDEEVLRGAAPRFRGAPALALARVEPLDLSGTTWFEFPHPDVVSAVTYAARRGINRYGDPHAATLRSELAHRLERYGVYVKPGAVFGASDHVRVQVQDAPATERFLRALDGALGAGEG